MSDDRRRDDMIQGLREHYNDPPRYPKDEIEHGVISRSRERERGISGRNVRIPMILAASLALFLGGVVVGRATHRSPSQPMPPSTSVSTPSADSEPSAGGYTVSWF